METWMKIAYALVFGAMFVFLLPRAKAMLTNSPKPQKGDWSGVIIPILGVILLVLFLIQMVR